MTELLKNYPGFQVYLAGPIDFVKDRGRGFRATITEKLLKIGLDKSMILDPCKKPVSLETFRDFDSEADYYDMLRKHKMWDELETQTKMTIHVDLRMVDLSDVIIAVINPKVFMFGTIHEIVQARQQKKPVLLVDPRGKEGTSIWALGLVGHHHVFTTEDEAIDYLGDVLSGRLEVDMTEWLFLHTQLRNGNAK